MKDTMKQRVTYVMSYLEKELGWKKIRGIVDMQITEMSFLVLLCVMLLSVHKGVRFGSSETTALSISSGLRWERSRL